MKLIIGLGNPGEKYKNNRHNTGFLVVDQLKTRISKSKTLNSKQTLIFKSKNFMNDSGSFVKKLTNAYHLVPSALYIVHDDLDIRLGEYKIQFGKGPKDNNGLNDIYEELGTKDFWHVRIGVDNRDTENRVSGKDYVLEDFTYGERKILDGVINKVCKEIDNLRE